MSEEVKKAGRKPAVKKEEAVEKSGVLVFTTQEYKEYSEKNGRIMGRSPDEKTQLTSQELRVLINAGWTPKAIKDKHGISDDELRAAVNKLSKEERRDKAIEYNDFGFRR